MQHIGTILPRLDLANSGEPGPATAPAQEPPAADCALCHNARWLRRAVPVGHPQFGLPVPCACHAASLAATAYAALLAQSRLAELGDCTFARFDPAVPGVAAALLAAQSFAAAGSAAQSWLVLAGGPGSGKTHLAAAIGQVALERGQAVYFAAAPDLLDHLRATYAPESAVSYDALFEQVRTVPLLLLDDLGAEQPTPWVREKLYQLLNARYTGQLATVITTNLPLRAFEPRLASRLGDRRRGAWVTLSAADYRARAPG